MAQLQKESEPSISGQITKERQGDEAAQPARDETETFILFRGNELAGLGDGEPLKNFVERGGVI